MIKIIFDKDLQCESERERYSKRQDDQRKTETDTYVYTEIESWEKWSLKSHLGQASGIEA